jgi:GNAT superfamily N-acetyltransferase
MPNLPPNEAKAIKMVKTSAKNLNLKITFKKAGSEDLANFFALFQKNIQANFPEYSAKITKFITEKGYTLPDMKAQFQAGIISIYLAFLGEEVIGFLMTRFLGGGVMLAEWLGVEADHQNKGIGTSLLQFCISGLIKE